MTSIVQPKISLSGNSLSFMRSNFVHLRQHFLTKEICQEREATPLKSLVHTENIRHGEKYHSLSLDPKRTQFPRKSHSYNSFMGEFTEKNDSKLKKDKEKSASARKILTHSDYNNITENRTNGSASLQHPDVNGTAHSECLLTNQHDGKLKHPLTNSHGKGVIRPVPLIYTPKPPLSNGARNTTQHLRDTPGESWNEDYKEYGFETNSVQKGGDLAANQVRNLRDLTENGGLRAKRKSHVNGTIYYSTGDHMTTDATTTDSTESYTLATASIQPVNENSNFGKFNSDDSDARASYCEQETYMTARNGSYQEKIDSDKAGGNNSDHSHSQGANKDVRKKGSTGVEAQNPRRVIRVISLKDKDFLSRAKRNTIGQVSRSHSSSLPHEKTARSTNGGDVPLTTPLTRSDKVQEIIPRPKFEEVNGEQSKMATSEEVSQKSENRVRVEVKVNLQPQNIATVVAGHELRRIEKEILTFGKVQGKDELDSGTVKSVITENDSLTSLEPREMEVNTKVVGGQWKLPKIDNEKQYMPQKQVILQKQLSVKLVTETEKQNSNDKDDLVNGLTKVSRTNQLQLDDKLDILPIIGAMNSECFNETLINKDHENVESVTQIYTVNNHNLDLDQQPKESFARKCESSGGYENFREVKKEIKNTFADTATEKDNCFQSETKMAESTPQSTEKERDSQDPQPPGTVKREVQFAEKQKSSRRVRRAMTISTMNEEITEAMRQFYELSADSWQRKDDLTQSGNNLDTTGQSCKDGLQTANEGDPNNQADSSGSAKSDMLERTYNLEPRLWRLPVRRPLSRSNTVITDDRSYLKHLSEEVRTMLILDARQRKLNADKIHRRNETSPEENQLKIDIERKSKLSTKPSEEVICPRHLDSIDILKFETLPLEERHFGKAFNKERNGVVGQIRTEELREEMSSETSTKLTDVSPAETSCDHVLPDVTDSVVVHEFSELISASTTTGDHTYIGSELSNTGSPTLNRSNDCLYDSGDMLTNVVKSMVILAASEQYMRQVEALATAEYEALRRRPRKDGKVFLPRRPLHQNSLPENDTLPLTKTDHEMEEN